MYQLLRELKMNVREIHSRKPQLYRTRISDEFKESKQLILVSSDVSSRGMNYPDVTLVIQVCFVRDVRLKSMPSKFLSIGYCEKPLKFLDSEILHFSNNGKYLS